ncbi:hypothetical protein Mapa_010798 [Marchantia paleacea]|nr:hypothetical protein Mapa_010798 [Marchantia paleacea]
MFPSNCVGRKTESTSCFITGPQEEKPYLSVRNRKSSAIHPLCITVANSISRSHSHAPLYFSNRKIAKIPTFLSVRTDWLSSQPMSHVAVNFSSAEFFQFSDKSGRVLAGRPNVRSPKAAPVLLLRLGTFEV